MFSELKKRFFLLLKWLLWFGVGLLVFIAVVCTFRTILWPGGTGVSDTLDELFWGNTLKVERNKAILSKTNEAVISKTVEKDKKGNIVKTIEINKYDDKKTLWDWLSLLGVPLTLFFFGAWLQEKQQERADNETKEEVLQTYFDRLSVLLIDKNLIALSNKLNSNNIETEEKELLESSLDVIRARTLSILRRFANDAERKTSVMDFLIETDLVCKSKLNLSGANLSGANLSVAKLIEAELEMANLSGANLIGAKLSGANLLGAKLIKAELEMANLSGATLSGANLSDANLSLADLSDATFNGAKLIGADLSDANLNRAKLLGANLTNANLSEANLSDANLIGAILESIKWDSKTLWPDKSKFIDAIKIPEDLKKELGITP
jgi:uncharacterized protein YjbI with pentapeptide repeats